MRFTDNYRLPLYEYKDGSDLVKGYNKTAEFVDCKVASLVETISSITDEDVHVVISSGAGEPQITETSKIGDIYVDTSTNDLWICNEDYDGVMKWFRATDSSRPSKWFVGNGSPTTGEEYQANDMYLDSSNADVWMFVGDPSEGLEVDASSYPMKLVKDGKIIGRNWFYDQGTSSQVIDAFGPRDIEGCPAFGVKQQTKRLPIASYIVPFEYKGRVSSEYDLYFRLSSDNFDSGRHFEHHLSDQTEYVSEAEVAITRASSYSRCYFTIDPGDDVEWTASVTFTTHGLYQAYDYANMIANGVKWFDKNGNIEYLGPWIRVCNLAASVTGAVPPGGKTGQVLMKSSDEDFKVKWANVKSSQVLYTHNTQSTVASALDDLYVRVREASSMGVADSEPVDSKWPVDEFDKTPSAGSVIISPSGDIWKVIEVTDTDVIVEKTTVSLMGPRGTGIFAGADYPESTVNDPKAGDLFVSTSTYDLYQYQYAVGSSTWQWSVIGNIRGAKGDKGENGVTPHIGENGNWFIGDEDTGVKAAVTADDLTYGSGTVADELDNINVNLTEIENEMRAHRQVPDGGVDGQLLKMVGSDYEWADPPDIATDDEVREFLDFGKE